MRWKSSQQQDDYIQFKINSFTHLPQRQPSYGRLINDSILPTSGSSCRTFRDTVQALSQGLSSPRPSLAPGGGTTRDPGNEVESPLRYTSKCEPSYTCSCKLTSYCFLNLEYCKMIEMPATPMLGSNRDGWLLLEICQRGEGGEAHGQYFYLSLFFFQS